MTSRWDSSDEEDEKKQDAKKPRKDPKSFSKDAAADSSLTEEGLVAAIASTATTAALVIEKMEEQQEKQPLVAEEEEEEEGEKRRASESMYGEEGGGGGGGGGGSGVAVVAEKKRRRVEEDHNPLLHGCRSVDEYQRLNFIDQGTFGMVFRARCRKTGEIFALKQVKLGAEVNKVGFPITALRETNILLALSHENIVRVREMVVGSSTDKVFMVMEYIENDLKACMSMARQPFSTAEVKCLMLQLMSAVDHMHKHWYIHRDLKTSNLLYSNTGRLAVCDFGLARKYGSPLAPYTFEVVTLWYRPPELLLGQRQYSTPLDIWSCACIFVEMLTSKPLFPGEGEVDQMSKIFRLLGTPSEDRWPGVSALPNFGKATWRAPSKSKLRDMFPTISYSAGYSLNETGMDLLSNMLALDPSRRLSAEDCLQHLWLAGEEPRATPLGMMPRFQSASSSLEASSGKNSK